MVSVVPENFFTTNIIDPTIRVVTLSDLHGDIQSLIIALRDCAKVIQKKNTVRFDNNIYDQDMESELLKDLNNTTDYVQDLNYEWVGTNTHVVICGDFIDPVRTKVCLKPASIECSWYPQIELKIFMFINAINRQANIQENGGKIIKLLGNHELNNIIGVNLMTRYINPNDQITNYYNNKSRMEIFNVGNPGFEMLFEGGCGILVKINNVIFVHGGLVEKSYSYYNALNQFINNPINQFINNPINHTQTVEMQEIMQSKIQKEWTCRFSVENNFNENSILWNRNLGTPDGLSTRIKNGSNNEFCQDLVKLFEIFSGDKTVITENPEDLKLVVGHCVQSDLSIWNNTKLENGITYSTYDLAKSDAITDVFNGEIYQGKSDFTDKGKIFGITMECGNHENNHNKIYRVDIGSSRGYDYFNLGTDGTSIDFYGPLPDKQKIDSPEQENRFLYSKTPQVLIFNTDGSIDIVKSKMKNTRIHLPRPFYEHVVKKYPVLNINDPKNLHYQNKYLKYKNKYFKLKNKY
jgi:hypothetical protein